jgi:Lrp/AsnC family leucine-responsive transcriptional regulator
MNRKETKKIKIGSIYIGGNSPITVQSMTNTDTRDSAKTTEQILKLEEAGIITGYSAHVDLLKLGYNIKAFINLEVKPIQKPEFYPFIAAIPNVIECNCITGNYSMLIKVAYRTTLELDAFIGELQKFGTTQTQIVFSTPVEHRGVDVNFYEPEA